jgi:hypothetical protein
MEGLAKSCRKKNLTTHSGALLSTVHGHLLKDMPFTRKLLLNFLLPFALATFWLLALSPFAAQADWPNTNVTKFVQMPDLSTNGMDIFFENNPTILADDFVCTNTGPISDIHLWISSQQNTPAPSAQFELSIWTDVPAITNAAGRTPSHPGQRLWSELFTNGQYVVVMWATNLQEQFWNLDGPSPQFMGPDTKVFQYNFYPQFPFTQTGTASNPVVYWLGVSMTFNDPAQGWKTSPDSLAPDNAVLGHYNAVTNVTDWKELLDPRVPTGPGLNFSFALTTPRPPCCPETNTVKWLQRPDLVNGFDVASYYAQPVADDFPCTNTGPITDIHLWGAWDGDERCGPTTFYLSIWSDVPANPFTGAYSHPGTNLWSEVFSNGDYVMCPYATKIEDFYYWAQSYTNGLFSFNQSTNLFYFCFYPTNPFVQLGTPSTPTNYWLEVYVNESCGPGFGWKTSADSYNDGAVVSFYPGQWLELTNPVTKGPITFSFKISGPTNCQPPGLTCTNKTVECGSAWTFDLPTLSDHCCGTNVTVTVLNTTTNFLPGPGCPVQLTRTWLVTDCIGLTNSCSQAVTMLDRTPPTITCPGDILAKTCGTNTAVFWTITATSVCSSVTTTSSPPSGTFFLPNTTNTVSAVAYDACGNTNTCSFTVAVIRPTLGSLAVKLSGANITLLWADGILEQAPAILGPWTDVSGALPPSYVTSASSAAQYYRLRCGSP